MPAATIEQRLRHEQQPADVEPVDDRAGEEAEGVTGRSCARASAPTASGDPVRSSTSQYAAICCIQVPMNETAWLTK